MIVRLIEFEFIKRIFRLNYYLVDFFFRSGVVNVKDRVRRGVGMHSRIRKHIVGFFIKIISALLYVFVKTLLRRKTFINTGIFFKSLYSFPVILYLFKVPFYESGIVKIIIVAVRLILIFDLAIKLARIKNAPDHFKIVLEIIGLVVRLFESVNRRGDLNYRLHLRHI